MEHQPQTSDKFLIVLLTIVSVIVVSANVAVNFLS
jgi:hypothetical protein